MTANGGEEVPARVGEHCRGRACRQSDRPPARGAAFDQAQGSQERAGRRNDEHEVRVDDPAAETELGLQGDEPGG